MADSPQSDSAADLAESLSILANETRLRIVRALAEAGEPGRITGLPYAELKAAAGVADNGRFNYHLDKLKELFIVKRDDEYHLQFTGRKIVRTLLSGTLDEPVGIELFEIGAECLCCGGEVAAKYTEEQVFHVFCPDWGTNVLAESYPSRGVRTRERRDVLDAVDRKLRHSVSLTGKGVCEWCGSRPELTLITEADFVDHGHDDSPDVYAFYLCDGCGGFIYSTVGKVVLSRSPVIAFFHDHGIDLAEVPVWKLAFAITNRHTEIESQDPWLIELTIPLEDEELRLELDGDLAITDHERRAA